MRRSSVVRLTLLPMLATAAVASIAAADPPSIVDDPPPMQPLSATATSAPGQVAPQQVVYEPTLSPPGMTPTIYERTCDEDPSWMYRSDCVDEDDGTYEEGGVIRGGFGSYFYGGGG
ncbi:MAG: hypothetical protein ACM31C_07625 [Acidobacteriota bacterium]